MTVLMTFSSEILLSNPTSVQNYNQPGLFAANKALFKNILPYISDYVYFRHGYNPYRITATVP